MFLLKWFTQCLIYTQVKPEMKFMSFITYVKNKEVIPISSNIETLDVFGHKNNVKSTSVKNNLSILLCEPKSTRITEM